MQDIAKVHYILFCCILPFSVFVNKTLYQKVKDEEHQEKGKVVQRIIKVYSIIQCVGLPVCILSPGILCLSIQYLNVLELSNARYLISSLPFLTSLLRDFVAFHTLIIAITRYTFVVFDSRAEVFGIQKLRKIFIRLSIVIPFVATLLFDATTPIESTAIIFDYFYGDEMYSNATVSMSDYKDKDINMDIQSPIYYICNSFLPDSIVHSIKLFWFILLLAMYSNIIEAFLYAHILVIYKRYSIDHKSKLIRFRSRNKHI